MGFVFTIFFFVAAGGLVCLGWISIDQLCACTHITPVSIKGVMGLSVVIGAIVGAILSIVCWMKAIAERRKVG